MRDNHSGMPEIIDAFEEGDKYNAVVEIVINGINKKGSMVVKLKFI
jgi:hypothetical protein